MKLASRRSGNNKIHRSNQSRPLAIEALEDRRLLSAKLLLSGPQTLVPYADVNVSNSAATGESEMTVAINPTNPLNVVGFSHDYNSNFNTIQVFYSLDGGASWTRNVISDAQDGLNSDFRFDPTVMFDSKGNLFIGYCASVPGSYKLVVGKSTDGGVTFPTSDFRLAHSSSFVDKPYLGTGPSGPGSSDPAIYITWDQSNADIGVVGSKDGGNTWTPAVMTGGTGFYAGPVAGPNGELYVAWQNITDGRIKMRTDPDGLWGPAGWNSIKTVRVLTGHLTQFSIPPQSRRGIYNNPTIDVDRTGGPNHGRVYVAFNDRVAGSNIDVYLSYSDDQGTTWTNTGAAGNVDNLPTSEFHPWVAVDQSSGSVNVLYKTNDGNADTASSTTRVASSFDGGLTFPSKVDIATQRSKALLANYGGEFLDYTGFDVHNGTMHGFWSDNRGASPGTYTADLESYTAKAAFVSTTGANKLVVNGDDIGPTDDRIVLRRTTANPNFLEVRVNGVIQYAGLIQSVNQIELNGLAGNNAIVVQNEFPEISITVNGGTTGRNLLIAGPSAATLVGGIGDDILVGGTTVWDTHPVAIDAIMAEWTRTDLSWRQRMVHIVRGGGLNGTYVLNPNTVIGNEKPNLMSGLSGRDLFYADPINVTDFDSNGEQEFPI